jgi:hypothetical protein
MNGAISCWGSFGDAGADTACLPMDFQIYRSPNDSRNRAEKTVRIVPKARIGLTESMPSGTRDDALRLALPTMEKVSTLAAAKFDTDIVAPISQLVQKQAFDWLAMLADLALNEVNRADQVVMPSVHPTPSGGIQFEWHRKGYDLEIQVLPSGQGQAYLETPGSEPAEVDLSQGWKPIEDALKTVLVR